MTKTIIIAALALSLAPAAAAAQVLSEADYAQIEAEAKAAAEEAMKPENVERRRSEEKAVVDNAMRQLSLSSDPSMANKLPLPEFTGLDAMRAVLRHSNAWEKYSGSYHDNEDLIEAMTGISMTTGTLLYYEWSCDTGRMEAVAGQYIDIVDNLVTTYPERIMLKNSIGIRDMMGYPRSKSCNRDALSKDRADFQESLAAVLEQTVAASPN
ncbi:hypothetical protein [Erythrobacter aureus]|uniref:Uncharacterized protein n=1 Tax=Erythrobacter aureus TaxID=2182384 RepID=A0A345YIF7_9SPHN|nr:hypothetical protein [Erythrobacter aureus]AXK43709.1 hypothetical protein DVR09_14715 [Erythrobacter aureus]